MAYFRNDNDGFYSDYERRIKAQIRRKRRGRVIKLLVLAAVLFAGVRLFAGCGEARLLPVATLEPVAALEPVPVQTSAPDIKSTDERYFYRLLTSSDYREIYLLLRDSLARHEETVEDIRIDDVQTLMDIYEYVYLDYPEYFWVTGGCTTSWLDLGDVCEVALTPQYCFGASEYETLSARVESACTGILASLGGKSDYEKVKGVYEYLINTTQYDLSYQGKTLYELFTENKAVCDGYARAAQYLLTKLGVETLFVTGTANNGGTVETHAWNIVKVSGSYYQMDVTWGDPFNADGSQTLSYDYLCITDAELILDHRSGADFYPPCTATDYNYYVHEGRLLETYDEQLVGQWLAQAYDSGQPLSFKAADSAVYAEVYAQLIDSNRVFGLLQQVCGAREQAFYYGGNEGLKTVTIYF